MVSSYRGQRSVTSWMGNSLTSHNLLLVKFKDRKPPIITGGLTWRWDSQ